MNLIKGSTQSALDKSVDILKQNKDDKYYKLISDMNDIEYIITNAKANNTFGDDVALECIPNLISLMNECNAIIEAKEQKDREQQTAEEEYQKMR